MKIEQLKKVGEKRDSEIYLSRSAFYSTARNHWPAIMEVLQAARLMLNSGNYIHEDFGVTALEEALNKLEQQE